MQQKTQTLFLNNDVPIKRNKVELAAFYGIYMSDNGSVYVSFSLIHFEQSIECGT